MHGYQPNRVIPPSKLKTALCMDSDHAIRSCKPKTTLCLGIYCAIPPCKPKTTLHLGINHVIPPCKPKIALCILGTNHVILAFVPYVEWNQPCNTYIQTLSHNFACDLIMQYLLVKNMFEPSSMGFNVAMFLGTLKTTLCNCNGQPCNTCPREVKIT